MQQEEKAVSFELFVNGTLMRGLELHGNLEGAEFLGEAQSAPTYRVYSIDDRHPGMFEVGAGGVSVKGELYLVDDELWARIEAGEPPHLYRGEATLSDGRRAQAVLYPRELAEGRGTATFPSTAAGVPIWSNDAAANRRAESPSVLHILGNP